MDESDKKCEEIRGLLTDRAMGQLGGPALSAVEEHLAGCARCRKLVGEVAAAVETLDDAPAVSPSSGFDATLRARIKAEQERELAERATVLGVLVAAFQRLRRFELGAAVYPLVGMALAYVAWAVITREPYHRRLESPYDGPPGVLRLWQPSARDDFGPFPELADLGPGEVAEPGLDMFRPEFAEMDIAVFEPAPQRPEPREWPGVPPKEPKTLAELRLLPKEPPAPLILPGGAPRGSALARARFATIRNSNLRSAISSGLVWLCRHQESSGAWTARASDGRKGEAGRADVEVTAAGALALMEAGFAPSGRTRPARHLRAALTWLIRQGRSDGTFAPRGARQLRAQAMAVTALSEALRLSDREAARKRFRPIVQAAVDALVERQAESGEWRDAELTTMALMATGAARAAGLAVDAPSHERALAWLGRYPERFTPGVYASEGTGARERKSVSYAVIGRVLGSAEAVLGSPAQVAVAAAELASAPVVWESGNFFRWYAATLAAYRLDGRRWREWRTNLVRQLYPRQEGRRRQGQGSDLGSWAPHPRCEPGGRAYSTAMAVLSLAASCGHSPVYGGAK